MWQMKTCPRRSARAATASVSIGLFDPEQPASVPEDRPDVVGARVTRPALEHGELPRMVEADVERAVAALREPGDARPAGRRDRPVACIDALRDRARRSRPAVTPPTPFTHSLSVKVPVEPNGITRISGRAREARRASPRRPPSHRLQEGRGRPGTPCRRYRTRTASWMHRVAARQVDVDGLPPPAEGSAGQVEAGRRPPLRDPRRVAGRREAARMSQKLST